MSKVSVIVPIYNSEKYIERCVRSLFEQTLNDIEYVFIDDCSRDNSISIIKNIVSDYPERKSQIKLIRNEKNKGVAKSRIIGLENSNGKYFIFCDSDDCVDTEMYGYMYNIAEKEDYDYIRCDYNLVLNNKRQYISLRWDCEKKNILGNILLGHIQPVLWSTMIKMSLYKDCSIIKPIGPIAEDMLLLFQFVFYSNKWKCINKPFYFHYENYGSIMNSNMSVTKYLGEIENIKRIIAFCKVNGLSDALKYEIYKCKVRYKDGASEIIFNASDCKYWMRTFPEINFRILFGNFTRIIFSLSMIFRFYPLIKRNKNAKG